MSESITTTVDLVIRLEVVGVREQLSTFANAEETP